MCRLCDRRAMPPIAAADGWVALASRKLDSMFWSRAYHGGNQRVCNRWYGGGAVLNRLQRLLKILFHPGGREKEQHPGCRAPGVAKFVDRFAWELPEDSRH